MCSVLLPRANEATLVCDYDQLSPVPGVHLGHYMADMCFGGGRADIQPRSDLSVRHSPPDERQHLALAIGEDVELWCRWPLGSGRDARSAISRRVTLGAKRPSPWATTRMPSSTSSGGASFSSKPLAPARMAAYT